MTFWIDPRFQINYSSYYLQGILSLVGKNGMHFRVIEDISVNDYDDFRKGLAIICQKEDRKFRIFIDTWDNDSIHRLYYDWSDVYAKVNVTSRDKNLKKLLAIGPSFGVQLWNPIETLARGLINFFRSYRRGFYRPSFQTYMLNYAYTFVRRVPYKIYRTESEEKRNYVFALHTLWYDSLTDTTTNRFRAHFCRLCKRYFPEFEGGLFLIPGKAIVSQFSKYKEYQSIYKDLIVKRRIPLDDYLAKTKYSALVFNTPSVEGCLGWKLGEYLAMGKAIVSMPINHIMPGDFQEGVHYALANNIDEIEDNIQLLCNDDSLRLCLAENAHTYFEQYLSPMAVMSRIIAEFEA